MRWSFTAGFFGTAPLTGQCSVSQVVLADMSLARALSPSLHGAGACGKACRLLACALARCYGVRSADDLAIVHTRFTGLSWLFMGAANSDAKLYDDEIQAIVKKYPDQFRVDYALSREQKNKNGGKGALRAAAAQFMTTIYDLCTYSA